MNTRNKLTLVAVCLCLVLASCQQEEKVPDYIYSDILNGTQTSPVSTSDSWMKTSEWKSFVENYSLTDPYANLTLDNVKTLAGTSTHEIYQEVKSVEQFKFRQFVLKFFITYNDTAVIYFSTRGLETYPTDAYLLYLRGRSLRDTGRKSEGLADLNKAISLRPRFAEAYVERGTTKWQLGDISGAKEDYQTAYRTDPDVAQTNPDIYPEFSQ